MPNPKIIHIDTEMTWRGGQRQATYLHEGLLDKGFDTIFFTKENSSVSKYLKKQNKQVEELPFTNEFDIISAYKLAEFAKKGNYNIAVCHNAHSVTTALLAKIFYRNLKIIVIRRVDFKINNGIISKYKYHNNLIDRIVPISDAICNNLMNTNIRIAKITTIKSGIDLNRFNMNNPEELKKKINPQNKIVIGTISAIDKAKDFPTLINAISELTKMLKNVLFVVVGDGDEADNIKKLAKDKNVIEYIHFAGFQENIGDYLKMFDIFTLFSRAEGLGTSILDAMSVGLPIVATNAGGIPEVVTHNYNGLLVEAGNYKELADAYLELINNKNSRIELGKNSLQKVRDFDINDNINEYIKLFEELING